jgi:TonB family protein
MRPWILGLLLFGPYSSLAQESPRATESSQIPLSAFLDSAALVRALAALSVPEQPRELPPLFVVQFDSTGAVEVVESVLEHTPDSYAEPVAHVIRAHVRAEPRLGSQAVFLVAATGSESFVARKQVTSALPRPIDVVLMSRTSEQVMQRFFSRRDSASLASPYVVQFRFRVEGDGSVDSATVALLASSGDPELDREALHLAQEIRFRPSRLIFLDAVPAPVRFREMEERLRAGYSARVWVTLPFYMALNPPLAARRREGSARRWHGGGATGVYFGNGNGPFLGCYLDPAQGKVTVWIRTGTRPASTASPGEGIYRYEWNGEMALSSGAAGSVVPARIIPVATGGTLVMADVGVNDAVIMAFAATGQLTASALGETRTPPAAPRDAIAAMLGTCRAPE